MDDLNQQRRPQAGKYLILKIFFVIVSIVVLSYAEEDWRGAHDWAKFKRRWEAKGESFDYSHFIPPPVPDEQNFALTPMVASSYSWLVDKNGHELHPHLSNVVNRLSALNIWRKDDWQEPTNGNWAMGKMTELGDWQAYYRASVRTNAEIPEATNEFRVDPNWQYPAEDVLLALSRYDSDIEELRAAASLPYSRFPLEYDKENVFDIWLPHFGGLKTASFTLQLRAIAELQAGKSEEAAADTQLIFRLIDAIRNEPFLVSHEVRISMANIALQPIYEGLAQHRWSEAQLIAFDSELAKLDFLADYERSMRGEAVLNTEMVDYLRRTRNIRAWLNEFTHYTGEGETNHWMIEFMFRLIPSGWFHQNQISLAEFYLQDCLPAADAQKREFLPARAKKADEDLNKSMAHPGPYNFLMHTLWSPLRLSTNQTESQVRKFAFAQESVDLARVAIALERFRFANGKYPESLDQLKPKFMSEVPRDVIGGEPLNYRLRGSAFVLYSVGWNGLDEGGIPATIKSGSPNSDEGDWVWQYPFK